MSQRTAQEDKKYVAFRLEHEFYAIDVHAVSEVFVPSGAITPIPNAPAHVAGVINFRGSIVSVIDLKKRLSIKSKGKMGDEYTDDEDRIYVIIVRSGDSTIGLQVDYVESVVPISNENIQSTLDLIRDATKTSFIDGVARTDLGLTVILNLSTLLSGYDAKEVEKLISIRELIQKEQESDEVVVTSKQILDLDEDDISEYEKAAKEEPQFKKVASSGTDNLGTSPLDLNALTKAELLKIAMEMEIDSINTRSTKSEIVDAINAKMGG